MEKYCCTFYEYVGYGTMGSQTQMWRREKNGMGEEQWSIGACADRKLYAYPCR